MENLDFIPESSLHQSATDDPDFISENSLSNQSPMMDQRPSWGSAIGGALKRVGGDIGNAGLELGNNLANTALALHGRPGAGLFSKQIDPLMDKLRSSLPPMGTEFYSKFGINDPGTADRIFSGLMGAVPFGIAGEALAVPSIIARGGLEGAAYGATQSPNHLTGAGLGALTGATGAAVAKVAGNAIGGIANYLGNKKIVQDAAKKVSDLFSGAGDAFKKNIPQTLKNYVQSMYKSNKTTASELAKPLNDADVSFDVPNGQAAFPNYNSAAQELLAQRENLTNLFGNSSDMGSKLNKELNHAESFLNNKDTYGVNFKDVWGRIQNLGKMAAAASKSGDRNSSRLLADLRTGLSDDLNTNLEQSGNKQLSDQLGNFNQYYKDHVVPFWDDRTIARAAQDKNYIPDKATLANSLYKASLNNQKVFNDLPDSQKNVVLGHFMTEGNSKNMLPDTLASKWAGLTDDLRDRISQHNPKVANYFEDLSQIFGKSTSFGAKGALNEVLNKVPGGHKISVLSNMLGKQPEGIGSSPFATNQYIKNLHKIGTPFLQSVTHQALNPFVQGFEPGGNQQ